MGSLITMSLLAIFTSLMATTDSSSVDMGSAVDIAHDDDDFFTSKAATRVVEGTSICVLTHSFSQPRFEHGRVFLMFSALHRMD